MPQGGTSFYGTGPHEIEFSSTEKLVVRRNGRWILRLRGSPGGRRAAKPGSRGESIRLKKGEKKGGAPERLITKKSTAKEKIYDAILDVRSLETIFSSEGRRRS